MRIWAIVYNPTYTLVVSDGPIYLESVSVTRALDRLTRLSAPIAGNDIRALQYITARNVVEIYVQETTPAHLPAVPARMIGAFIIDNLSVNVGVSGVTRSIQGTGVMLALKDRLTLPGLTYDDETIENIFNGSSGLAPLAGWTAGVDAAIASDTVSVRFDGTNVFKSMQAVSEVKGLHLRHSAGAVVEVGPFGTANDYRLQYIEGDGGPLDDYDTLPLLIESMEIIEDAAGDFYNYILGFGAGQGDARLTLEKSTRTGIVTINDGTRDHYIIKDDFSIATYGQIERMVQIKKLAPVGTAEAQQVNAANALYDGLYENLQRHKEPQQKYRVTARNVQNTIQPGDKLRLIYQGVVFKDGLTAPYQWKDINDDFWVMSVNETIGSDGMSLQLDISNVDRYQQNAAEIIVGMVDSIEVNNIGVQPYPVRYQIGPYQGLLDSSNDVTFKFPVDAAVLRGVSFSLTLRRNVFTATATGAASGGSSSQTSAGGGDHRHRVAQLLDANVYEHTTFLDAQYRFKNVSDNDLDFWMQATQAADWYTEGSSGTHTHNVNIPAHSHDLDYGVFRDEESNKFTDCTVTVNGVEVASGAFATTGGADEVVIDITDEVLNKAGGFRGDHTIVINCSAGQGEISAEILLDVEIGTVRA